MHGSRQAFAVFFVGCLIFLLAGCSFGTTTTQPNGTSPKVSATVSGRSLPTQTAIPSGTVLYRADWSHGVNGWQVSSGWKVVQGELVTDGSGSATITAPYKVTVANYAVEARIQVVRVVTAPANYFDIFAKKTADKDGYRAGANGLAMKAPFRGFAQVTTDSLGQFNQIDFFPGADWNTYRVEVSGNAASLFFDGTRVSLATSTATRFLSNGPIGVESAEVALRVSSFTIMAL